MSLSIKLLNTEDYKNLRKINLKKLNLVMLKDKKTLNGIIKLTVPKKIGFIKFYNQKLDKNNINEIIEANKIFMRKFNEKENSN